MNKDFSSAGQKAARYLHEIHLTMSTLAANFNQFMEQHGHPRRIDIRGNDDCVFLMMKDSAYDGAMTRHVARMMLGYEAEKGQIACLLDLDPNMATRTNEDPEDGTLLSESFHVLEDEAIDLLKRKCFAEMMAAAGPVAGAEYLAYYEATVSPLTSPTDRKPH